MLGHESTAMTLDVYSGLFDADLDAVAARMDVTASPTLRNWAQGRTGQTRREQLACASTPARSYRRHPGTAIPTGRQLLTRWVDPKVFDPIRVDPIDPWPGPPPQAVEPDHVHPEAFGLLLPAQMPVREAEHAEV